MAGPEAANNASAAGVLAPLLTLGLPTSATAAVLLAAFQGYGLQPGPLLFELLGAWSVNGSTADLVILLVIGLVGMILGPLSEQQLRRALAISQGDPSVLLTRPISAALLAITAAVLVAPALLRVVALARR